jgi:hypothetical protein
LLPCAFAQKTNGLTSCFYLPLLAPSCFELRLVFGKNLATFSSTFALAAWSGQGFLGLPTFMSGRRSGGLVPSGHGVLGRSQLVPAESPDSTEHELAFLSSVVDPRRVHDANENCEGRARVRFGSV